jgi:hypothetical protein
MTGRMVMCPNCKNKFRAAPPETTETDEAAEERVAAEPRPKRPPTMPSQKTRRPIVDDDRAAVKSSREPVEEEVDELEEIDEPDEVRRANWRINEEDDQEPRRPRRKRNKKIRAGRQTWWSNPSPLTIVLSGIIALGFLIALVGVLIPELYALILLAAMVGYIVGHFMVVIAAFQESAAHGALCILFGPYTWIFALMHFDQVRTAWLVWGASFIFLIFIGCGAAVHAVLFGTRTPSFSPRQGHATRPTVRWVASV